MQITTPLSDELGRYLDLSGLELKLTAQNMANIRPAATPRRFPD